MLNWGTGWRQQLRLAPLYLAMLAADRWPARGGAPAAALAHWAPGISVIVPERDTPSMLGETLAALDAARAQVGEPTQVIVVVNGAAIEGYAELAHVAPHATHNGGGMRENILAPRFKLGLEGFGAGIEAVQKILQFMAQPGDATQHGGQNEMPLFHLPGNQLEYPADFILQQEGHPEDGKDQGQGKQQGHQQCGGGMPIPECRAQGLVKRPGNVNQNAGPGDRDDEGVQYQPAEQAQADQKNTEQDAAGVLGMQRFHGTSLRG